MTTPPSGEVGYMRRTLEVARFRTQNSGHAPGFFY
jgi:hypothetical protein